jgi:hypothetical protein
MDRLQEVDPMKHVAGIPRQQMVLFPESLDEYIAADNPVRFSDAFVDSLDLAAAGFGHTSLAETGRPPYDLRDLLNVKMYSVAGFVLPDFRKRLLWGTGSPSCPPSALRLS